MKYKYLRWTDYKNQKQMDDNNLKGKYLGEAVVVFNGSLDEKLGEDGTLTGEGANPAKVTIYGINGADDIRTYLGMTTPKSDAYSTLNAGEYQAYYQDMAKSRYGIAGAKAKGIETAFTYQLKTLDGTPLRGTRNGEDVTMGGVFFHRTDWDGTARNSSKGCPIGDGRQWRSVETQLGRSLDIRFRLYR